MRHCETKTQSAEILRLVLAMMAKHEAPYHPLSYAVWYEFLTGVNSGLKQDLEPLLNHATPIDGSKIEALHAKHIGGPETENSARMRAEMRRVMDEMMQYAADAGDHATQYGNALGEYGAVLRQSTDAPSVTARW